jgi:prepilin-type N-terminal cleavage/methylation domain-containing protein
MKQILRPSRRNGVSLIELIVVMSAASIILSLSAGLIHRVMHAETKARSLAAIERTSLRLADAVRRDVHSAAHAVTDAGQLADGAFLQLETSDNGHIEYHREEQTIHRLQLDNDRIIAREQFVFPSDFDVQLRSETSGLVALTLTSHKPDSISRPEDPIRLATSFAIDLQVVAALRGAGQ